MDRNPTIERALRHGRRWQVAAQVAVVAGAWWLAAVGPSLVESAPVPIPDPSSWPAVDVEIGATPPPTWTVAGASELSSYFDHLGYDLGSVRDGQLAVPRVVTAAIPADMRALDDLDERKAVFLQTMLPLILQVNDRILRERSRAIALRALEDAGLEIPAASRYWLEDRAAYYRVSSGDWETLLRRMDMVPPALALAQSAEETGWGTSRFAREGNALFGQHNYDSSKPQMAPQNGADYRLRVFDDALSAVAGYVRNLNTHRAYRELRRARAAMRDNGELLNGFVLAGYVYRYSERGGDYVAAVRALIRQNDLLDFDDARLTPDVASRVFLSPA